MAPRGEAAWQLHAAVQGAGERQHGQDRVQSAEWGAHCQRPQARDEAAAAQECEADRRGLMKTL